MRLIHRRFVSWHFGGFVDLSGAKMGWGACESGREGRRG